MKDYEVGRRASLLDVLSKPLMYELSIIGFDHDFEIRYSTPVANTPSRVADARVYFCTHIRINSRHMLTHFNKIHDMGPKSSDIQFSQLLLRASFETCGHRGASDPAEVCLGRGAYRKPYLQNYAKAGRREMYDVSNKANDLAGHVRGFLGASFSFRRVYYKKCTTSSTCRCIDNTLGLQ
jgi:hypothetical protein